MSGSKIRGVGSLNKNPCEADADHLAQIAIDTHDKSDVGPMTLSHNVMKYLVSNDQPVIHRALSTLFRQGQIGAAEDLEHALDVWSESIYFRSREDQSLYARLFCIPIVCSGGSDLAQKRVSQSTVNAVNAAISAFLSPGGEVEHLILYPVIYPLHDLWVDDCTRFRALHKLSHYALGIHPTEPLPYELFRKSGNPHDEQPLYYGLVGIVSAADPSVIVTSRFETTPEVEDEFRGILRTRVNEDLGVMISAMPPYPFVAAVGEMQSLQQGVRLGLMLEDAQKSLSPQSAIARVEVSLDNDTRGLRCKLVDFGDTNVGEFNWVKSERGSDGLISAFQIVYTTCLKQDIEAVPCFGELNSLFHEPDTSSSGSL